MNNSDHKILLVDNEKEFLDPLEEFVESLGYQVYLANNGRQALEIAEESGPFSIVISDQRMPEMFGTDFFKQLKDISPHTVRILITAYEDRQLIRDSVNVAEVFRILKKPIGLDNLATTLELAIEQYESKLKTLKRYKILFVDNEMAYLHSMKKRFLKYGYDVLTTTDSKEAVRVVNKQGPIAVVVADETFNIDGVSILEIIKNISPRTVKVLFTLSKDQKIWEDFVNNVGVFRVLARLYDGGLLEESIFAALKEYDRTVGKTLLSNGGDPGKSKTRS